MSRHGACLFAAVLGLAWLDAALAQDTPAEFGTFLRQPAPAPRAAVVPPEAWQAALRGPESLGPPFLREADARLLQLARSASWTEVMTLVRSGAASVHARDLQGGNVLASAAAAGQDKLVRELLDRGADRDRIGDDGFTPLGAAAFYGRHSTLQLLLRAGADPRRFGATGHSALHLAAMAGHRQIIDALLLHGVDATLPNRQGESALDVAAERGQQDAMARLIEAGVDPAAAGR